MPIQSPELRFVRGDSTPIQVTLKDTDISDYTVFFTVKKNLADTDDDAAYKGTNGPDDHSDSENGQTIFQVQVAEAGVYHYDIQFKDGDGVITSKPPALLEVIQDVTQRTS